MPRYELEYPKEPFSTVKRLNERGIMVTVHKPVPIFAYQSPG